MQGCNQKPHLTKVNQAATPFSDLKHTVIVLILCDQSTTRVIALKSLQPKDTREGVRMCEE